MKPQIYAQLLEEFQSEEHFLYWLANLVALTFNQFTGESLLPGHNSLATVLRIDRTMPIDLYINITAWWQPSRAPHFGRIRQHLQAVLARRFRNARIEVALYPPGAPPRPPIDFSQRIEDLFPGGEHKLLRQFVIRRGGIIMLGGLLQITKDFLLRICEQNQDILDQVQAKLDELGLSLAPPKR